MGKELKQQFEEVCKAYLDAFVKRHDLVSADWIGPGVGANVCANDAKKKLDQARNADRFWSTTHE